MQFGIGPNGERIDEANPDVQSYMKAKGVNADIAIGAVGTAAFNKSGNQAPQSQNGGATPPPTQPVPGAPGPTSPQPGAGGAAPTTPQSPQEQFYQRAADIMSKAQNVGGMKDLIDARNSLVSSRNGSVLQMTPQDLQKFPPDVQDALRKVQTSGVDEQIGAINSAIQARQNQISIVKGAYSEALGLVKEYELSQNRTRDDARNYMMGLDRQYPGFMAQLTPEEYQYWIDSGNPPQSALGKLTNAISVQKLAQNQSQFEQKQALSQQKADDLNKRFYAKLSSKGGSSSAASAKNFLQKVTTDDNGNPSGIMYTAKTPGGVSYFQSLDGTLTAIGGGALPKTSSPTPIAPGNHLKNPIPNKGGGTITTKNGLTVTF